MAWHEAAELQSPDHSGAGRGFKLHSKGLKNHCRIQTYIKDSSGFYEEGIVSGIGVGGGRVEGRTI